MFGSTDSTWLDGMKLNALYKIKGYALSASASAPVLGGTAMFGVGYVDAESSDQMEDAAGTDMLPELTRWSVSAGYTYSFSKRTNAYGVVTYMQDKIEVKHLDGDLKPSATAVMVGLKHTF